MERNELLNQWARKAKRLKRNKNPIQQAVSKELSNCVEQLGWMQEDRSEQDIKSMRLINLAASKLPKVKGFKPYEMIVHKTEFEQGRAALLLIRELQNAIKDEYDSDGEFIEPSGDIKREQFIELVGILNDYGSGL